MKINRVLGSLLLASAASLLIGALFLFYYGIVPDFLIELTIAACAVLIVLAYFVFNCSILAINIGTILGVFAPAMSISTSAHVAVLLSFGQNILISLLGALQFLGFFAFPITYVILRIVYRKRVSELREPSGVIPSKQV